MKLNFRRFLGIICCGMILAAHSLLAGVLVASFDIGTDAIYSGFGPYTEASVQFTAVSNIDVAATANGISFWLYGGTGYFTGLDSSDPNNPSALFGDYYVQEGPDFLGDNQGNFNIAGLNSEQLYDIYIIAPNGTKWGVGNVYGGDYVVTTGTADETSVRATGVESDFSDWVEGRDYTVFRNAMADGSGAFSGTFNRIDEQAHTGIAGIQIVAVPEPTTMGLVTLVGGILLLVRRSFSK